MGRSQVLESPVPSWSVMEGLAAQGKLQEALEACQQSLAISQRLAKQDKPTPAGSGISRSVTTRLAMCWWPKATWPTRLSSIATRLQSRRMWPVAGPSNATWQIDAVWSRYCAAKVLIRIKDGDRNEANRLVIEGIDINKPARASGYHRQRRSRYFEQAE
jgi:hypothetical protein